MDEQRKPVGYLMGKPIYEVEMPDVGPVALGKLTNEDAKRLQEKMAAERLCVEMPPLEMEGN